LNAFDRLLVPDGIYRRQGDDWHLDESRLPLRQVLRRAA